MSLNIIIDADVTTATNKIGKFVYTFKESFKEVERTVRRTSTSVKDSTDKMAESTNSFGKSSRNSLTALSLTLQDLPFGFIGIQNNLPGVIQGFGQMSAEAKTGASVMSQLKTALMGPAGLFLAFSAVTAGVTALTLKYGGLGNAIDAIFGKTNLLINAQKEYNKELAKEIASSATQSAEITILTKVLTDLTKPLKDRQAAYVELTKINPAVVAGIKLENISTAESVKIITENAKAIQKLLVLKAQEAAISNILTTNAEKLATLQIEEKKLQKDLTDGESAYNKIKKEGQVILGAGRNAGEQAIITINNTKKSINDNRKEQAKLNKVAESYINLLDPTIKGIAEIDLQTRKLTDSTKKQKEEKGFYSNFPDSNALGPEEAFSRFVIGQTNLQVKSIEKLIKARVKLRKETSKEASVALAPKIISGEVEPLINQKFIDAQAIAAEFTLAKELIDGVFFNPIAESFENFINTGKFTFDEFAKNIKANIAKIVAQIAASRIVELLGTIFAGPIAGGLSQGGGFLSAIGSILPAFRANTRFEGVRPLGLGGGQKIDLVLRGTDLVGAINRTNDQISRVG
jgi:hypothetical protein